MDSYVKLFQSILDSTVWQESLPTKVVWITILAMKDSVGYVGASVPGLAKRAGVTVKECEIALDKFRSPDPYSRTKQHEGRRIVDADGGWMVLNHEIYKVKMSAEDRKEYKRVKQAQYRAKRKYGGPTYAERLQDKEDRLRDATVTAATPVPPNGPVVYRITGT